MNKRNLQIQTDFDDQLENNVYPITASPQNKSEAGATLLERTLSCILAQRFIKCWQGLKNFYLSGETNYKIAITSVEDTKLNRCFVVQSSSKKGGLSGSRYSRRNLKHDHSDDQQFEDIDNRIRYQKSVKSLHTRSGYSRANLLNDIAGKLKNKKRTNSKKSLQSKMMDKLNSMEQLLIQIRDNKKAQKIAKIKNEEQQFLESISQQMTSIRQQIQTIKKHNQQLIEEDTSFHWKQSQKPQSVLHQMPINYQPNHPNIRYVPNQPKIIFNSKVISLNGSRPLNSSSNSNFMVETGHFRTQLPPKNINPFCTNCGRDCRCARNNPYLRRH